MTNFKSTLSSWGIILLLTLSYSLGAQPKIPVGDELARSVSPKQATKYSPGIGGIKAFTGQEGTTVLKLITETRPDHIYSLNRSIPLKKKVISRGRTLLLSFQAKTVVASLETGEAKLLCLLRQSDSHKDNLSRTVSIGRKWRTYYFPYTTTKNISAGELGLSLQFGYPEQEITIRNISLMAYGPEVSVEDLPETRLTYAGREADADWRLAAAKRIERNRKGSFSIAFVDGEGNALPDVPVSLELTRHNFGWGAAVNAQKIAEEPARLEQIARAFNLVVFENDLKIKRWNNPEFQANTLRVMDQLLAYGIDIKGHVLIWPGFRYLPARVRQMGNKPERVTQLMEEHVADILKLTDGKVGRWDVVNEAYSNRDLQSITGSEEILYNGFRQVAAVNPAVGRFTNEFGIISRGGHDETKQQWYYDYIKRVDQETGGLVDGIGIQCHMGSDLTPPERVLELLDYYGELKKKISISEFTIDLDDEELRFDYTRDFLTVAFSHPAVSEFLFWGHYGPTHQKAAIYDENWQPGDMGQAFFSLVHGLWKTELSAATDVGGRIQGRGFYGKYAYEYKVGDEVRLGYFELRPGEPLMLEVVVE